jgi:Tol biopolymer transport system component
MSRRRLYLAALMVEAVLVGCAAALLAVSEKAEAAYPGENGHIAYVRNDGEDHEIYAINGGGGGKVQLTDNATGDYEPSYSPNGKKIVYSGASGSSRTEIYTINAGGGGKFKVTDNATDDRDPSWGSS